MIRASSALRVVVVDDEKLARDRLRRFLVDYDHIVVAAECDSGEEAVQTILAITPDLVFLDVQMPGLDGFGVLSSLRERIGSGKRIPVIVFVTAYDQYALRAFDVHAVDYIVKPFNEQRLRSAIDHARAYLSDGRAGYDERIVGLLEERNGALEKTERPQWLDRIAIRSRDRIFFVKTSDVEWIETAKNYVRLHVGEKTYRVRDSLTSLSRRLDPSRFVRVHRRMLVNVDHVKEAQPWFSGDWIVLMQSGARLRMSRNYRELISSARLF